MLQLKVITFITVLFVIWQFVIINIKWTVKLIFIKKIIFLNSSFWLQQNKK